MKFKTVPETIPDRDISISIYPIPIPLSPVFQTELTEANKAENGTGKLQRIRLTVNIAVTVRQESLQCRE
jgi:hypothetical protein